MIKRSKVPEHLVNFRVPWGPIGEQVYKRSYSLDTDDGGTESWPETVKAYSGTELVTKVRDRELRTALTTESLSGTRIPKVALPRWEDDGEILRWLLLENVPGSFPYTAGTFPFKREGEDPTRMFAGEGDAFRGVIDLVRMRAYTWPDDNEGVRFVEGEIPAGLQASAKAARDVARGRVGAETGTAEDAQGGREGGGC